LSAVRWRPIPQSDPLRPRSALPLTGGRLWFDRVAVHERGRAVRLVPAAEAPKEVLERLSAARAPVCGLELAAPRIMGVVNVTPDSFSDGGLFAGLEAAVAQGRALVEAGADLLDIGGESTRPGSDPVPVAVEMDRVIPVIRALREGGVTVPISIDTRKAAVARAAFDAGADMFNDVSALGYDPESAGAAAEAGVPVCLMHVLRDPKTMQDAPHYEDVLLDIADFLAARVAAAEAAGIPRGRILVDPGIGFGKTVAHNLALVRGLSLFHDLGCAILFGASRKRFIGAIAGVTDPLKRGPGSTTVALEALRQGAQVIRVHDVAEMRQALALWMALTDPRPEAHEGQA
jgi:dihydropteroate synthase